MLPRMCIDAMYSLTHTSFAEHHAWARDTLYVMLQTERVTKYVQSLDPSRLYNAASGWVDAPVGDIIDMHKYVGPGAFNPTSTRASVLGEFGGLGLKVDSHQWIPEDSFSYEMQVRTPFVWCKCRFILPCSAC